LYPESLMKRFFRLALSIVVMLAVIVFSALITLRLALHGGEVAIPDFASMTVAEASNAALHAGLDLNIENKFYSTTIPAGRILSQAPAAGSKVRHGWEVRVTQSLGPQQVTIPDVAGDTQRVASIELRQNHRAHGRSRRSGYGAGAVAAAECGCRPAACEPAAELGSGGRGQFLRDAIVHVDVVCSGHAPGERHGAACEPGGRHSAGASAATAAGWGYAFRPADPGGRYASSGRAPGCEWAGGCSARHSGRAAAAAEWAGERADA
jgi:hypothetical protein